MNTSLKAKFLDAQDSPQWQSEMMLNGTDIQNNPLRDLVTPRNPKSHYTFTNYLKLTGRLFEYLNLPTHYPLRREYANYIQWVSSHFEDKLIPGVRVEYLKFRKIDGIKVWELYGHDGSKTLGRCLVLGTGRSPNIPENMKALLGKRVFHLSSYLKNVKELPLSTKRIGVLGASQSAVEIILDLLSRFPDAEIYSIQRGFGFRLKDTSPFSDRVYFPEFIDYFFNLSQAGKNNISSQLRSTNYSSVDSDVLNALYIYSYEEKLSGRERFKLLNNTQIDKARLIESSSLLLELQEVNVGTKSKLELDALVLATGFLDLSLGPRGEAYPPLLKPFKNDFSLDENGILSIGRDYQVLFQAPTIPPLFLNGLCESSHGLGDAGSFSLLSLRSELIASAVKQLCAASYSLPQDNSSLGPSVPMDINPSNWI